MIYPNQLTLILIALAGVSCMSSNDSEELPKSEIPTVRLPVEGVWKTVNSPGHDRYAFDLAAVDGETQKTLKKSRFQHILGLTAAEDSYSWGQPVYAPVDGVVVRSVADAPDRRKLSLIRDVWSMIFTRPDLNADDLTPFAGNHLIIRSGDFYVFMAHMQQQSLQVSEGDEVETGQPVGRVGNSGLSLIPHLHFQLFDQIDDLLSAKAPPFRIDSFEQWASKSWELKNHTVLEKGKILQYETQ